MNTLELEHKGLTDEQKEHLHREGYLVVDDVFTDADLQPVIDEVSADVDRLAREFYAAGKISRLYDEHDFDHRLAHLNREAPELPSRLWNAHVLPSFFDLMRTPRLLDVMESLCGPEIIASSVYRLRPKVPSHKQSAVPWHQDSGYFEPYCDKALVVTCWLPLVDATREKGCMWVRPRQHMDVVLPHRQAEGQPYLIIDHEDYIPNQPTSDSVCCPVRKGGVLLLTNRTPHASFDNTTDKVRWSMDLRYQSASLPTNAKITRLPNESKYDPSASDAPIACYPPEPDFLVRSVARPEQVLTTREQFLKLRKEHESKPITQRWNATLKGTPRTQDINV